MKNILLLTDFSKHAKAASETALILSQKLHTNLLLLNTFVFYPTTENYAGGPWDFLKEQEYENKQELDNLKQQLEELSLKTLGYGDRRPVISYQVEDIGFGIGITDVLEQSSTELIVMGTHEDEIFRKIT